MNKYMIFSIIGAVIVFGFLDIDNLYHFVMNNNIKNDVKYIVQDNLKSQLQILSKASTIQTALAEQSNKSLEIKIKNITADNAINNNVSSLHIVFDVINPNQNTMLLEGITYNVYSNNHHIITGDIGNQIINDVFQSQSEFPIIKNSSLLLKDVQKFQKGSEINNELFNSILKGQAHFLINGTLSLRQTTDTQDIGGNQQFKLVFP